MSGLSAVTICYKNIKQEGKLLSISSELKLLLVFLNEEIIEHKTNLIGLLDKGKYGEANYCIGKIEAFEEIERACKAKSL